MFSLLAGKTHIVNMPHVLAGQLENNSVSVFKTDFISPAPYSWRRKLKVRENDKHHHVCIISVGIFLLVHVQHGSHCSFLTGTSILNLAISEGMQIDRRKRRKTLLVTQLLLHLILLRCLRPSNKYALAIAKTHSFLKVIL